MRVCAWAERFPAPVPRRFPRFLSGARQVWLAALLVTLSEPVHAEGAPPLTVEREPGAEDCPDTAGLIARVETIIGRGSSADATPYRITFTRGPQGFAAAIRSGREGTTVRYLDAHEPNCAALAHATAIALAVLFDAALDGATPPQPSSANPDEPAKPPPPPPGPTKPAPNEDKSKTARDDTATSEGATLKTRVAPLFSVGAAALVGVLRPVVPALLADAGLEIKSFRGTLGLLWVPPQTIELPPGSAREDLISGTLRLCFGVARGGALRFDLCSGALVGAASAEARGFTTSERHTELFLAFPAELSVSARSRFIGWQLGASGLVLCPPNQFEVGGVGATYRPPPVAGMLALRAFFEQAP